jgi:signal transduction histidine kinase
MENKSATTPSLLLKLMGDPVDTRLENRVLNGTMLLVFITGVFSTAQNLIIGNSPHMLLSTGLSTLGGIAGYWFSRRKRVWKPLILPIYLYFMLLLGASWVTQAGSNGSIGYYFFLFLTTVIVLFQGPAKFLSVIFVVLEMVALLGVEFLRPDLILPYDTPTQQFVDVAFSMIVCLMMSAMMVYVVYREYQRERGLNDILLSQVTREKSAVELTVKQKQRLISMVCHDIANALTVAQGSFSLLKLQMKTAEPPSLERTRFALNKINEIVSSVRLLEAVEQERFSLELEQVTLSGIMENVRLIFKEKLADRNIRIICPSRETMSCKVIAEPRMLANQVISNLVSNAIRFSHPGSAITIDIARSAATTSITVSDTGIGMPAELLGRLFDPTSRTTRPGTDGEPGTGFGMLTAKRFVELFGGSIDVASKPEETSPTDHGTTVTVTLESAPHG